MRYLAQQINIGDQPIQGQLKLPNGQPPTVAGVINTVLPVVITFCGIILFFVFIWGGYDFMLSRGDPGKIKSARAKITYGIIGFVILVLSYFIVNVISTIFGVGRGFFGK